MFIAILHFHLNRGGVTQVITSHLRALAAQTRGGESLRVAVLYGGRREGWADPTPDMTPLDRSLHVVPGLDYDDHETGSPRELAGRLRTTLRHLGFTPEATVLHVHNHALGKNLSLPPALVELASEGYALLLQIHDFAEDFRPANYQRLRAASGSDASKSQGAFYPQAAHVHYAVLNRRDERVLYGAGVDRSRLHSLPNPVGDPGSPTPRDGARRKLAERFGIPAGCSFALYPVRGIRRKNLGETLLWSAVAGGKWRFGITLPPLNPIERPSYERWKALGTSLRLPMVFEVGGDAGLAYTENMSAADRVLTTSVAEGFGLVFLEPWLAGKPLIGRDLPEITGDFAAAGLRFEHLRASFAVPVAWIGADAFQQDVERWYVETLAQYGLKAPPADLLSGALDALIEDGQVDFAALTSARQAEVIRQVVSHGHRRQQLRARNAWIDTALGDSQADAATVRHNADVVRREYSLDACGRRLMQIYRSALASPRSEPTQPLADAERILGEFLNLSRFQPIRVEP